jgi:hypothetical protein
MTELWVHLSLGSLTVESGATMSHYAPDVVDDLFKHCKRGFAEILDQAATRGLVQIDAGDDDDDSE